MDQVQVPGVAQYHLQQEGHQGQEHRHGQDPDVRPGQPGGTVSSCRRPGVGPGDPLAAHPRPHPATGAGLPPVQPRQVPTVPGVAAGDTRGGLDEGVVQAE